MRRSAIRSALIASALAAQGLSAQSSPVVFLDKAYFSPGTPSGKNLRFEGEPTAHFFLFNRFGNPNWQKGDNPRPFGKWEFAGSVSEMFVVRMTKSTSDPVLTPSYHQGILLQAIRLGRSQSYSTGFSLFGVTTGAVHYSNGQRGCTYLGFGRDTLLPDKPCTKVIDPALLTVADTEAGDFSTTYLPIRLSLRRGQLIDKFSQVKWQWTLGAEFQYHVFSGLPGAMNVEQAAQYGKHQLNANAEFECRRAKNAGVVRVNLGFTQRFAYAGGKSPNSGSLELSYVVDTLWGTFRNVGLFARQHVGFDYYNINFQKTLPFWSLGVIWDLSRLDILSSGKAPHEVKETKAVDGCFPWWRRVPDQ